MIQELAIVSADGFQAVQRSQHSTVPSLFIANESSKRRFIEFFTAEIRNPNTRAAYALAVRRFSDWCDSQEFRLEALTPVHIAAHIEHLGTTLAKPSVKQHLAALRMLFDYLVIGQVIPHNPATSVRGPKYVVKQGLTPVLTRDEARQLFESIGTSTLCGLRDRALIGVMVYSFARISAVLGMNVEDYYQQGKRWRIRLSEKGGKRHEVPCHHKAEEFLDAYLHAAGIAEQKGTPLLRTIDRKRKLTESRLHRAEALAMIKRRSRAAGLGDRICCHTFRATGITCYLEAGGTIEKAQAIASHESPRTTKLYDRMSDSVSLDEIERIQI